MGAIRRLLGMESGPIKSVNHLGVVSPGTFVDNGRYVDVPVPSPTGDYTTAWSNGMPVVDPGVPLWSVAGQVNVEHVWRTQPNVRKVVDFIARNVASIPLHVHERVSDTNRVRVTDHPLADLLGEPQAQTTPFRFWRGIVADGLLFDRWVALKVPQEDGRLRLVRVPASRVQFRLDYLSRIEKVRIYTGLDADPEGWRDVDLEDVVFDHGYSPTGAGLTPMQTLSDILAEGAEAVRYRRQVWANGARSSHWLEVPVEAMDSGFDQKRFEEDYRARFTGNGPDAGGAPLLHDGVKLHEMRGFSARDMEDIEGRRLTAIEVASAFHIAPELVGAREGNYSNVREFRQMLYRDSLGPYITAWEQSVNAALVPDLAGGRRLYVEANVEAKLRGSFEDQAQYLQAAVGAPYMLRSEARARLNLPEVDGADEIVTPLNVIVGGQASPQDSGSQNLAPKAARWHVKASDVVAERLRLGYEAEVAEFVERQQAAVTSALGAKSLPPLADAWDVDRWDRELAAIVFKRMRLAAATRAGEVVDALGVEGFDETQMLGWLAAAARSTSHNWNAKTYDALAEAVREPDWRESVGAVFATAAVGRAAYLAATTTTEAGNFGAAEAAQSGGLNTKTWVVTSGNPRSSHAGMNGETVRLGEAFSNGARWPGDAALPEEERANCRCEISFGREG